MTGNIVVHQIICAIAIGDLIACLSMQKVKLAYYNRIFNKLYFLLVIFILKLNADM